MTKFILPLPFLAVTVAAQDSTSNILDSWRRRDKLFNVEQQDDVVLVMGDTGSGKSTLTLLLTDYDLNSVPKFEGATTYLITDNHGRVGNTTSISQTKYPELKIDRESGVAYYDCPGFGDTRSEDYDIPITYIINKLLTALRSFKIVLMMNFSSVRVGESHSTFPMLAENVAKLLKNVTHYADGISMVATKVQDAKVKVNNKLVSVDDTGVLQQIVDYLTEVKRETEAKIIEGNLSDETKELNMKKVELLNVLLKKEANSKNHYERIGIFRVTNQIGPLKGMKYIQEEKKNIQKIITQNTKYVRKQDNVEFGHIISFQSAVFINELIHKILENDMYRDVSKILDEVQQYFIGRFEGSGDLQEQAVLLSNAEETLEQINSFEVFTFLEQLQSVTRNMTTDVAVEKLQNGIKYMNFLLKVHSMKLIMPDSYFEKIGSVKFELTEQYGHRVEQMITGLMKGKLESLVSSILKEVEQYYQKLEVDIHDILLLNDAFSAAHRKFSRPEIVNVRSFADILNFLNITVSAENSEKLNDLIPKIEEALEFSIENHETINVPSELFHQTRSKIRKNLLWYRYLKALFSDLTLHQNNTRMEGIQIIQPILNKMQKRTPNLIGLQSLSTYLQKNYSSLDVVRNEFLSKEKKNFLTAILTNYINYPVISCSRNLFEMKVNGSNIRMSDVVGDKAKA